MAEGDIKKKKHLGRNCYPWGAGRTWRPALLPVRKLHLSGS